MTYYMFYAVFKLYFLCGLNNCFINFVKIFNSDVQYGFYKWITDFHENYVKREYYEKNSTSNITNKIVWKWWYNKELNGF